MLSVIFKMTVSADKRNEILQTIKELLVQIRRELDCVSCHCYLDVEADDVVIFEEEWKTKEALSTHLRSGHFKVLLGAMKLLSIKPDIRVKPVVAATRLETIMANGG